MKNKSVLLLLFILFVLNNISGQEEASKWRFEAGLGVNSLRLGKGQTDILSDAHKERKLEKKRYSFQGNVAASYLVNKNFRLVAAFGITHAKGNATRKIVDNNLFGPSTTTLDTVMQKYLLAALPIYFRWHIIAEDNEELEGVKPFIDFGINIQLPINNESVYRRKYTNLYEPLFGPSSMTVDSYSGEIKPNLASVYFAFGVYLNERFTLALSFTGIKGRPEVGIGPDFDSLLTALMLSRHF